MDLVTVLHALLQWGLPAAAAGVLMMLALAGGYLFYRKTLHGSRKAEPVQAVSAALLFCWLFLVLALTSVSRGANFSGAVNLHFLSGYVSAWNSWSLSELQLILFNILMFAPFGFLLPLLWKKAEDGRFLLLSAFGMTMLIEVFQYLTGTGIFELDDLFHNLLGSLAGYSVLLFVLSVKRERRVRLMPAVRMLAIPGIISLILGGVFLAYEMQPYGNLSIVPSIRQNMKNVTVIADAELSDEQPVLPVYRSLHAEDSAYVETIRASLAEEEGLTFSRVKRHEDENPGFTGTDADGEAFQMLFFFRTGEWNYTAAPDRAAVLTEEMAAMYREQYETWMASLDLLPENAVFSMQNEDTLRWDASPAADDGSLPDVFQRGTVLMQFREAGCPAAIYYQMTWNEKAGEEKLISQAEAYGRILSGDFEQYVPFQECDVLHVTDCVLTYMYDSKGFYQPVYQFSGYLNDPDSPWSCAVAALM